MDMVTSLKKLREESERDLARASRNIEKCYLARQLLAGAGFMVTEPTSHWGAQSFELEVTQEQLPAVRRALDCPLKVTYKGVHDAENRIVKINLEPTDFNYVTISYLKQLPKPKRTKAGSATTRCKFVKVRIPAKVETRLVCERVEAGSDV